MSPRRGGIGRSKETCPRSRDAVPRSHRALRRRPSEACGSGDERTPPSGAAEGGYRAEPGVRVAGGSRPEFEKDAMGPPPPRERIRCVPLGRALPNVTVFVARFTNGDPGGAAATAPARCGCREAAARISSCRLDSWERSASAGAGLAYGYLR